MSRISLIKNSFTSGEISPSLLGRGDLKSYENGASKLRNVFVHSTGGLSRRSGLRYVDTARGDGRLIAFEFNTEQVYLMVFTDQYVDVYRDGVNVANFSTPWTLQQAGQINWAQSADTLFVAHPDVTPKKITRTSDTNWTINDLGYSVKNGKIFQPHHKFADDDITLTASATTGNITLTASADFFQSNHMGVRMRLENREVIIDSIASATVANATVMESSGLVSTSPTNDWEEQSFSSLRGWPTAVSFHQDRMVIGGTRDLPNRLWFSKSSDLFNFDLGTGLDDESIEFAILSDQVNAIRAIFSSRNLQIFTSGAEWKVSGDPITPSSLQLSRQTRIGSPLDRSVPPRDVDGATLFVPRNGPELREFLYSEGEQAYQATDLAMLAHHMINDPVDQDFINSKRLFHMVMSDGSLASLTIYRTEDVKGWTLQDTDGFFRSLAVVGDDGYVLTERNGSFFIEVFDAAYNVDSGLISTDATPKTTWSGLGHLEGETVTVVADGALRADKVVASGAVELDEPASSVQIGLAFTHIVEPLPPAEQTGRGNTQGGKVRPVEITFRLQNTAVLRLDTGKGFVDAPFKRFGDGVLDSPPAAFTGDKSVRVLGWKKESTEPLWRIEQDSPFPFTLLAVKTEIKLNS